VTPQVHLKYIKHDTVAQISILEWSRSLYSSYKHWN